MSSSVNVEGLPADTQHTVITLGMLDSRRDTCMTAAHRIDRECKLRIEEERQLASVLQHNRVYMVPNKIAAQS